MVIWRGKARPGVSETHSKQHRGESTHTHTHTEHHWLVLKGWSVCARSKTGFSVYEGMYVEEGVCVVFNRYNWQAFLPRHEEHPLSCKWAICPRLLTFGRQKGRSLWARDAGSNRSVDKTCLSSEDKESYSASLRSQTDFEKQNQL